MGAIKNTVYAGMIATALIVGAPKQGSASINKAKPVSETIAKDSVKAGVVKNSNMVKIEYTGKIAIVQLTDLIQDLGISSLDRTYRTTAMVVPNLRIKTKSAEINGGLAVSISGKEGVVLLYLDSDLKNFVYIGIKTSLVFKGEKEERFNSGGEDTKGIQRPALMENNGFGICWVSYAQGNYELNYVPHSRPLHVSTTFEAGSSTKEWAFNFSENGKLQILDGSKEIVTAWAYDKVGEIAENMQSLVASEKTIRTPGWLNLNIIEDTRGMAGNDIYIEFSQEQLSKFCGLAGNWNTDEIVKPMSNVLRGADERIPHVVVTKNGVGIVEVPLTGDTARAYNIFGAPFNANEKNPREPQYIYAMSDNGKLFGTVEVPSKDAKNHNLAAYYLPGGFVFKKEMDGKGDQIRKLSANNNGLVGKSDNGSVTNFIQIDPLAVRIGSSK